MIEDVRKEVDKIDVELVKLLAKRMELAAKIGKEKKASGMDIHQRTREVTILDQVKLLGDTLGLSDVFITNLYQVILIESRRTQETA